MSGFKKAERKQVKLKLAITGPSGSGKTYSALRIANGMGGKIAVIDTENGSASLYSDRFEFDVLEITPPYTNEKYLGALQAAEKAGYDILIIDSLSHQWAGDGGLLNKKEQMDSRGGNSYTNWAKMTPEHEKFKSAIVHADMHIIGTMRSKQDYVLETNDKGKQAPRKVGLAPVQRDGMEYEFTVCFDIAMNHEAEASKDRTSLFTGKFFQITENTGKELMAWLTSGKAADPKPTLATAPPTTNPQDTVRNAALRAVWTNKANWPEGSISDYCNKRWGQANPLVLSAAQFDALVDTVKNQTAAQARVSLGQTSWTPPEELSATQGAQT